MDNKAMVHISRRPAVQMGYGLWPRAKAFFRGFSTHGPLVEVAFEAFSGRYALPFQLQERYERRIRASKGKNGISTRILSMMKEGCSTHAQEFFAGMWLEDFNRALASLRRLSKSFGSTSLIVALRQKGTDHAKELTTLRIMAADSILGGNVTSIGAQQAMASFFAHQENLDSIFTSHAKVLHSSLIKLLNSDHTSPELRASLMQSTHDSGCVECKRELGNVVHIQPYKVPSLGGSGHTPAD